MSARGLVSARALAVTLGALVALGATGTAAAHRKASGLSIAVLSNRANLISGGDALASVALPAGTDPSGVRVFLNGADVTSQFAVRPNGQYEGLVSGLANGANTLTATLPNGATNQVTITNHPNGGPATSGPQVQPWVCQNGSRDPQCNAPSTYDYKYKSSVTGQFSSYDPNHPPSDVATTTTDNGHSVPYIVRVETGYQDRDQYQIAVLFQPGQPWSAWSPQPQFDHKLLITHGASCGIDHQSSSAPSVMDDTALSRGFAVMSTALDNAGHNCSLATEAESLIMAKEHLIEQYGTLRYTIGTGCSGGSLVQQQVANAYPGVYQGILPQCSFPDAWSTGQQLAGYHFTRRYFENPSKWGTGIVWTPDQIAAVEGHPNHGNAIIFDSVYWTALADPTSGCAGVPASEDYNPNTNPGGVRCTLADYMINVFGPRPQSVWGPVEQQLGHGFAGLPIGDVGVQFGLLALEQGKITPAQFVDLNSKIGGADIDLNFTQQRSDATEPALANDYRSGAVNETNNLTGTAIIDLRGPDPGAFHDAYRSWTIRARLEAQEGHFPKNQVIWFGETPLIGDPRYQSQGVLAMDRWLSAVEADNRSASLAQKVADDRPADVHDQCSDIPGVEQVSVPGVGTVCELPLAQTRFATPAMAAGEGVATDIERCQLKPLAQTDYYPVTFTPDQWSALQAALPSGVCDWSKPGVDQQGTVPWQTYQDDANGGAVVYGGRALGPAPAGSGTGWTSPAFDAWRSG
ncbi:MAG: hypothetical protein E6G56_03165 [Actinobacteria bacterium]|nr:MAG: hypothetical protein E6G56_03165 [Actinomycetota bacterium]